MVSSLYNNHAKVGNRYAATGFGMKVNFIPRGGISPAMAAITAITPEPFAPSMSWQPGF